MKKLLIAAAIAAGTVTLVPTAALAQASSATPGGYWTVQGIFLEPGQGENYLDYLAGRYRDNQEYAKSQGWITGYRILANVNRRADEPDLYLITEFARMATPQEQVARDAQMEKATNQTTRQAEQASGQRISMRRIGSNLLLQEMILRPKN